jgi:hypothetical protein
MRERVRVTPQSLDRNGVYLTRRFVLVLVVVLVLESGHAE